MAHAVRISGYGGFSSAPLLRLEPPWWDVDLLLKRYRFEESVDLGCRDYDLDLSVDEARLIHQQFLPQATTGVYDYEPWQKRIQPMLAELDAAFGERAEEFGRFHICIFEWESGL